MSTPYFAKVYDGWTGSVAVTYGDTVTVEPSGYESVASMVQKIARAVSDGLAIPEFRGGMYNPRMIRFSNPFVNFDMAWSGTLATRLGFTDLTYTGAASYEGPDDSLNTFYGSMIGVSGSPAMSGRADPVADGSALDVYRHASGDATIRLFVGHATAWTLEANLNADPLSAWDLAIGHRLVGRFIFDRPWTRSSPTRLLPTGPWCELVTTARGVAL